MSSLDDSPILAELPRTILDLEPDGQDNIWAVLDQQQRKRRRVVGDDGGWGSGG